MRPKNSFKGGIAAIVLVLLATAPALAHDYWLAPEKFSVKKGESLVVRLHVGMALEPETERELQKDRTERFALVTSERAIDLLEGAEDGTTPVLRRKMEDEGAVLLVMDRAFAFIELEDEKFSEYLEHEGLGEIEKLREKIGHRKKERERYKRCLKSLVRVVEEKGARPTGAGRLAGKVVGQDIEIVLLDDPFAAKPGTSIRAKVLFEGKPLAGKDVMAHHRGEETGFTRLEARTDANGVVAFRLEEAGLWVMRLVHMRISSDKKAADWESFWAVYTFEIAGARDGGLSGEKNEGSKPGHIAKPGEE
ncbi:MAG: DUF4198 domain-containing protein [Planctomycetota bacterium]|nr:DUF4198 domain-containing protein [Planctomycetota bacterium]